MGGSSRTLLTKVTLSNGEIAIEFTFRSAIWLSEASVVKYIADLAIKTSLTLNRFCFKQKNYVQLGFL